MPGRPAKKRRREPMEPKNNSRTNLSREGRVMTCSICHAKGHNKSRCARRTNSAANPQAGPQDDPQDETAPPENQCSSRRNKRTKASAAAVYCPLQTFRSHSGQMIVGRRVSHGPSFVTTSQLMELTSRRMMRQNNLDSGQQTTTSMDPTSTAMELPEFPTQASTTETEAEQRPGE